MLLSHQALVQAVLQTLSLEGRPGCFKRQGHIAGVSSATEAMLRVAAAEYSSIQWHARQLSAHTCQHSNAGDKIGDDQSQQAYGSFGCRLRAGAVMPAMLTAASCATSSSPCKVLSTGLIAGLEQAGVLNSSVPGHCL